MVAAAGVIILASVASSYRLGLFQVCHNRRYHFHSSSIFFLYSLKWMEKERRKFVVRSKKMAQTTATINNNNNNKAAN